MWTFYIYIYIYFFSLIFFIKHMRVIMQHCANNVKSIILVMYFESLTAALIGGTATAVSSTTA